MSVEQLIADARTAFAEDDTLLPVRYEFLREREINGQVKCCLLGAIYHHKMDRMAPGRQIMDAIRAWYRIGSEGIADLTNGWDCTSDPFYVKHSPTFEAAHQLAKEMFAQRKEKSNGD